MFCDFFSMKFKVSVIDQLNVIQVHSKEEFPTLDR